MIILSIRWVSACLHDTSAWWLAKVVLVFPCCSGHPNVQALKDKESCPYYYSWLAGCKLHCTYPVCELNQLCFCLFWRSCRAVATEPQVFPQVCPKKLPLHRAGPWRFVTCFQGWSVVSWKYLVLSCTVQIIPVGFGVQTLGVAVTNISSAEDETLQNLLAGVEMLRLASLLEVVVVSIKLE